MCRRAAGGPSELPLLGWVFRFMLEMRDYHRIPRVVPSLNHPNERKTGARRGPR